MSKTAFALLLVFNVCLLAFVAKCCARIGFARGIKACVVQCDADKEFGILPPIFMLPEADKEAENGIVEVCFGPVEGGVEVTVVFKDEDRPNKCEDCAYDFIRRPLFGRSEDIESFTLLKGSSGQFESIKFEGTFSGEQTWKAKMPEHGTATVPIGEFEVRDGRLVVWVNVWNHLFGPRNNNPDMPMVEETSVNYKCSRGTRSDIDKRYAGLISKVA